MCPLKIIGVPHPHCSIDSFPVQHRTMSSTHPVRLACQTCAQRKVRCDKRSPCTNCLKHGISCIIVERRRLPRGRPGKQAPGLHGEFPNDEHFLPDSLQLKRRIKGRPRTGEKSSKVQHQNLHESSPGPLQRKEAVNLPQLVSRSLSMMVGRSNHRSALFATGLW